MGYKLLLAACVQQQYTTAVRRAYYMTVGQKNASYSSRKKQKSKKANFAWWLLLCVPLSTLAYHHRVTKKGFLSTALPPEVLLREGCVCSDVRVFKALILPGHGTALPFSNKLKNSYTWYII